MIRRPTWQTRRMWRRAGSLAASVFLAGGYAAAAAAPAQAVEVSVHRICDNRDSVVDICFGFQYTSSNNVIRAYAKITAKRPNVTVRITDLILGDGNGVIDTLHGAPQLDTNTLVTHLNRLCSLLDGSKYNVHVLFQTLVPGDLVPFDQDVYAYYWPSWYIFGNSDYLCTAEGTKTYTAYALSGTHYLTDPVAPATAGVNS